jgi:hypothetical protein
VRPLHLDHEAFNDHMIDLTVVIPSLSFVLEIRVGTFGDYVNCVVGVEIDALM